MQYKLELHCLYGVTIKKELLGIPSKYMAITILSQKSKFHTRVFPVLTYCHPKQMVTAQFQYSVSLGLFIIRLRGFGVSSMHPFSLMAVTCTEILISSGFSEPVFITIVL